MDLIPPLGAWLNFDGVISIVVYAKQRRREHLIRIARSIVGLLEILWNTWSLARKILGAWIVLDGITSIVNYRKQRWYEHLVRIIRIGCGIAIIIWA